MRRGTERPVSIGILGDFTESGGKLARERAHRRFIGATSCHRLAKRTPPRAAQACAVSRLWQRGDKTCERRTKGHVHIRLIKNVCDLITYYTTVLVYKYDLTNKIRMHVAKDYIVGFVLEHSFELYNFYNMQ